MHGPGAAHGTGVLTGPRRLSSGRLVRSSSMLVVL